MLYCQACGAENAEDARFCNMCGAKIATSGEPGGPEGGAKVDTGGMAASAEHSSAGNSWTGGTTGSGGTHSTMSGSSVSLESIGVRSPSKTYAILIGGALFAFALGMIAMFVVTRGPDEAPATDAVAQADPPPVDDEIELGEPIPAGDLPGEEEIVTGGPRPTKRAGTGGSSGGTSGRTTGSGSTGSTGSGSTGTGSTGTGSTGSGSTGSGSTGTGSAGSGSTGSGSTGSGSTGSGSTGSGSTGTGSTGTGSTGTGSTGSGSEPSGTGSGSTPDWDRIGEGLEDPAERRMELYTNGIRRIIRDHYLARAQTCFSHATRTDEDIRGTVVVEFTIAANGHAEGAHVVRNTTGNDALGACLARSVEQWQLARPPDGPMEMQMPFSR